MWLYIILKLIPLVIRSTVLHTTHQYLAICRTTHGRKNEKLPRNPVLVLLTKSTHSHAFSREHSTRIIKFKLEETSISSTLNSPRTLHQRISRGLIMSAADVTDLSKLQKL